VKVLYWVFNYMPQWEAVSKEIASLRQSLNGRINGSLISLNTKDRRLSLASGEKRIPLPYGLPFYPLVRPYASRFDVNHLFASAAERFLTPILARQNGVLTIAKDTPMLQGFERNRDGFRRMRAIVVQGERDREILRQMGVRDEAIRLIRPGIPLANYQEAQGPFTILFASSPSSVRDFLSRGIYLIVRVAALLPQVRFLLVWRNRHVEKLKSIVANTAIPNVEIINGVVDDMSQIYNQVHASVLPALEHRSFIPCPRSGLESLAHGKPLLASTLVSISQSVANSRAGVIFEPTVAGLQSAIIQLREEYAAHQVNAQRYIATHFSPAIHLERYLELYSSLS
jgi:glycosyltransferase involved in cell wall biosynthesis